MSDNYRLAEHNVEMTRNNDDLSVGEEFESFQTYNEDGLITNSYLMLREKWKACGEPETIYVTVTAVIPTAEPADGVEVVTSVKAEDTEEFAERNPSVVNRVS